MDAEHLRAAALALPEAVEVETWEQPTFRVGRRIFCILGADGLHATVKATPAQQDELIRSDPGSYSVAPYVGRHGWVLVDLRSADAQEVEELLEEGWRQVAGQRLLRAVRGSEGR